MVGEEGRVAGFFSICQTLCLGLGRSQNVKDVCFCRHIYCFIPRIVLKVAKVDFFLYKGGVFEQSGCKKGAQKRKKSQVCFNIFSVNA